MLRLPHGSEPRRACGDLRDQPGFTDGRQLQANRKTLKGLESHMNPVLLTVWAALTVAFLALLVYRGQLTRYEDEQLFLNESGTQHEREMKNTINRKIDRIQPFVRIVGGAAGLATACAVGIYVWNAWQQIQ